MAISLDSISQMPQDVLHQLQRLDSVLARCECIEEVLRHDSLYRLAAELDRLCLEDAVIGYHFTRATPELIVAHGLQLVQVRTDDALSYLRTAIASLVRATREDASVVGRIF